ncbi:DUF1707 domain-containing protein [Nonomuraea endophytica]|uniref:DUF1707 domain-containing protein n=1 Tax=Nonomuraea endophytica TaxID=714136 RepID=UPI0037C5CAF9
MPARLMIKEADRDTAVRRVQEAYAQGHLTHQEMDDRLHQALTAETPGELAAVLPEEMERAGTIAAVSGLILRRGAWRVPRTLKVESALARVRLDLSRAVFDHPVVDIELGLGTGTAVIIVPRDATVDLDGLTAGWKAPRYKARQQNTAGPTIRISGAMGLGRLTIRHARR